MRLRQCIATVAAIAIPHAVHANLADYLSARKSCPPKAGLTLTAVHANPAKYRNAVLELRGVIAGVSRSDTASTVLLRVSDADTVFIQGSLDAQLPGSGESARALVSVQENGNMSLVSLVTETEIGDRQIDPPSPKPAVKAPSTGKPSKLPVRWPVPMRNRQTLASRTGLSPDGLALYTQVVMQFNPRLTLAQADVISRSIVESSYARGVDARLIMAIFATESGFKPNARSRTGAMGLGQLMPGTARSLGVGNAWDPVQNIQGAVRLIQQHWVSYAAKTNDFRKVFQLVCAAYNAGPNAVKRYGGVPPYRETRNYVKKVAAWYSRFAPDLFQG
ncbi:MAG TPA: lytic transglycosylase domain-containing protein [Armatimonadota bacterium]